MPKPRITIDDFIEQLKPATAHLGTFQPTFQSYLDSELEDWRLEVDDIDEADYRSRFKKMVEGYGFKMTDDMPDALMDVFRKYL